MPIRTAPPTESRRLRLIRSQPSNASGPDSPAQRGAFARELREGLLATPKTLPFTYFYDEIGSTLFDQICRLPEYYLTRTEDSILRAAAPEMVRGWADAPTLIELGSGSAEKTRRLITAAIAQYGRVHYVPIDVSGAALEASAKELISDFTALGVTGFVGDYNIALADVTSRFRGPKLIVFLGSSLGNYGPEDATALLTRLAGLMGPDDRLLLGTDLAKDAETLEAAYDDAQGVTAQFNKNLLTRINREFRADFSPERFRHRAVYRPDLGRVEMHLVSTARQTVSIPGAGLTVDFDESESIHTENSHKYTAETLGAMAGQSGFVEERSWTDPKGWFRVQRWRVS